MKRHTRYGPRCNGHLPHVWMTPAGCEAARGPLGPVGQWWRLVRDGALMLALQLVVLALVWWQGPGWAVRAVALLVAGLACAWCFALGGWWEARLRVRPGRPR